MFVRESKRIHAKNINALSEEEREVLHWHRNALASRSKMDNIEIEINVLLKVGD